MTTTIRPLEARDELELAVTPPAATADSAAVEITCSISAATRIVRTARNA